MDFDPSEKKDKPSTNRGVYDFTVIDCQDRVFRTGTEGMKLVLDVFLPDDRVIKVFENLFKTPKALWKTKQACDALGLDFEQKPQAHEFIGKSGKGFFDRPPNSKYLELSEFVPKDKLKEPPKKVVTRGIDAEQAKPKPVIKAAPRITDNLPF